MTFISSLVERVYNLVDGLHTRRLKAYYHKTKFDAVLDVGSHKGEFITRVIGPNVDIFAFEPQEGLMPILKDKTQEMQVVKYYACAVSNSHLPLTLYINSLSSTSSTKPPNSYSAWSAIKTALLGGKLVTETKEVPCMTLDSLMETELSRYGDILLKIDVEGAEFEVIEGAKKLLSSGKIKAVQFEQARYNLYHDSAKDRVCGALSSLGFVKDKSFLFPLLNFSDLVYVRG